MTIHDIMEKAMEKLSAVTGWTMGSYAVDAESACVERITGIPKDKELTAEDIKSIAKKYNAMCDHLPVTSISYCCAKVIAEGFGEEVKQCPDIRYEAFYMESAEGGYGCGRSCGVFCCDDEGEAVRHFKEMYCGGAVPIMLDTYEKTVAFWLPDKGFCRVLN